MDYEKIRNMEIVVEAKEKHRFIYILENILKEEPDIC